MRATSAVIAAIAVLLAAGCGTSGREADIRAVAERFAASVERGDGAGACALLTVPARRQLVSDTREPCSEAVIGLDVERSPVEDVHIAITSASARYARGGTLFFDETTDGWRIAAAGCEPKPDDEPYDCELEG